MYAVTYQTDCIRFDFIHTFYRDASKSPSAGTSDTGSPRPGSAVSPGATGGQQLPQGPRQQKPYQAQKKKKKKGGGAKW